jgi:hypothetical protein
MIRFCRARGAAVVAACVLTLGGIGCAGPSVAPYEPGADRYQFKFQLTKAPGETGTCTASASVRDRMARREIALPIFTARWGVRTAAAGQDSAYGARLEVAVAVDSEGRSGAFEATLRRGDQLIASRAATLPVAVVKPALKATPG